MAQKSPTRRDALKIMGAGAAAAWLPPLSAASGGAPSSGLNYFSLVDVRLGEGPFLQAQRLNADYLLRLEPDRMLHNFLLNAGLTPKAPVYGGWESIDPWIEIRCHGHTLGHYLTAAACKFQCTADNRFAERVDYIVDELARCQEKTGGWLTAFPDGVAPLADSLAGKTFAGVPWYTTHKVLAGLRDAHVHRGSAKALEVLIRFTDWIDTAVAPVDEAAMQKMLDREHGGMNEVCADLFALTKEPRYRELALRFSHHALLAPLAASRDTLDGFHANTQIPKVIGFSRIGELTQAPDHLHAASFFWRTVVNQRSYATGGHGDGEFYFPVNDFAARLGSAKTMETCCTHNMLRLTRSLHARTPSAEYMDYFERALFNGILASQDPESGMNTYFQATRPGYVRLYHTPFDSFWCCTGSGIENHARHAESIFAHAGDRLYVNLFIPATLEWRERGLTITQQTRFPDEEDTRLTIAGSRAQTLELAVRHPHWCDVMTISVNGRRVKTSRTGAQYALLKRSFRPGDVVEIRTPMKLRLEPLPNAPEHAALVFGPIVLAARLGTQGLTPGSQIIVNERQSGQMLNEKVPIPAWPKPLAQLPASLVRDAGEQLSFTASGFADGKPVHFAPYYRITHERYNLYWSAAEISS